MNSNEFNQLHKLYHVPEIYLSSFFGELRTKIENELKDKLEENSMLISFLIRYEAKIKEKIRTINKFEKDFKSIEENIEKTTVKEINHLKFKIERYLFSNKTLMFIKSYDNLKNVLFLINDIYLSERRIRDMNSGIDSHDESDDSLDESDNEINNFFFAKA